MTSAIILRNAQVTDAADLAILDNLSSHGMSLAFWQHAVSSGEGEDALALGRERFMDSGNVFGWSNATVAEIDGVVVGSVTTYEMTAGDDDVKEIKRLFPGFVPVFELFTVAAGDWFVDSLAVFAPHRGKGIAGKLLDAGLERGRNMGHATASLVVESDNTAAVALYRSRGFAERDSRSFADKANGKSSDARWLLMSAEVAH